MDNLTAVTVIVELNNYYAAVYVPIIRDYKSLLMATFISIVAGLSRRPRAVSLE